MSSAGAAGSSAGAGDYVEVSVLAEDEKGQTFKWSTSVMRISSLRSLRRGWAARHSVPEEAVGLLDAKEQPIDFELSPAALGWPGPPAVVNISVFPLDSRFFPLDSRFEERPGSLGSSTAPKANGAAARANKRPPVPVCGPGSTQKRGRIGLTTAGSAAPPAKAGAPARAAPEASPVLPAAAAGKSEAATPAPAPMGVTVAAPGGSSDAAQTASVPTAAPVPVAAPAGGNSDAAAPAIALPPAPPKAAPATTAGQPGMDEPIEYQQENPKKVGSQGWLRYEKYKMAKTPAEALKLGSAKGDLAHDWKKGFYKRAPPPA